MRRIFFILLIFSISVSLWPENQKSHKIGKFNWLSEENSFEDVIKTAKKNNKPVLAVFSATWCGPCQSVKKNVFSKDKFKEVADKAILLYVEQTTKKGMEYNKKFNIVAYPTFKIFSSDGIMLDTGNPKRTVKGFSKWIDDVMSGKNFYAMSKKLKKDPNNRELLIRMTEKMGWGETKKKIEFLKRAVKINSDMNDKLTKEAYEKLGFNILSGYPYRGSAEEKKKYKEENDPIFNKIINAYYPDKFEFTFKKNRGISNILNWYNKTENYKKSVYYFEDFIKRTGKDLSAKKDTLVITDGIACYFYANKKENAKKWIEYLVKAKNDNPELMKTREFPIYFSRIPFYIVNAAKKLIDKKKVKEGKKMIYAFCDDPETMKRFGKRTLAYAFNDIAWTLYEKKLSDKKSLEIAQKAVKLSNDPNISDTLASIYSQLGNLKKAIEIEKKTLKRVSNKRNREEFGEKIAKWELALKNGEK